PIPRAQLLTDFADDTARWIVLDIHRHARLVGAKRLEGDEAAILTAFGRLPTDLPIGNPVSVDGVPFVSASDIYHPVARLVVEVGDFLDEAHELREVVEMGEHRIDLLDRRIHHD